VLQFDLSLAGTAQRNEITLEFERCVCQITWYPDGFRVLPTKSNPFDDIASSVAELAQYGREKIYMGKGNPPAVLPHQAIYRYHLARVHGMNHSDAFSLQGVMDTMSSMLRLADLVYD
jgi:hypothetical protein